MDVFTKSASQKSTYHNILLVMWLQKPCRIAVDLTKQRNTCLKITHMHYSQCFKWCLKWSIWIAEIISTNTSHRQLARIILCMLLGRTLAIHCNASTGNRWLPVYSTVKQQPTFHTHNPYFQPFHKYAPIYMYYRLSLLKTIWVYLKQNNIIATHTQTPKKHIYKQVLYINHCFFFKNEKKQWKMSKQNLKTNTQKNSKKWK